MVQLREKVLRNAQLLHLTNSIRCSGLTDTGHQDSGAARGQADATKVWGRRSSCDATPETLAQAGRPPSSELKPHADAGSLAVAHIPELAFCFGTNKIHRFAAASVRGWKLAVRCRTRPGSSRKAMWEDCEPPRGTPPDQAGSQSEARHERCFVKPLWGRSNLSVELEGKGE